MRFLVTGGAGFIGSNYVRRLLLRGERVVVYDDLSRPGVRANLEWLLEGGDGRLDVVIGDVADADRVGRLVADCDVVVHLAGQTAVTTSIREPMPDFRANALGTLTVLEAARHARRPPVVLYASTNKVYGGLEAMTIQEDLTRYRLRDLPYGVPEDQPIDCHSPYACSKGSGDQYVRDYHRIYGLRTVVLRQSCIYGPRQMGATDQGWLAWFMLAALDEQPITIFGNGKQARDVLYVEDLLDAYDAAIARIETAAGGVYNIGGGPERVLSVWAEFRLHLERLIGRTVSAAHAPWRPGDQLAYVSDIRKAARDLQWTPSTSLQLGLARLFEWVDGHRQLCAAGLPR